MAANQDYQKGSETMTKIGSFTANGKTYPTLTLNAEEQNPKRRFTFGADKARLILAHLDAIRQFAEAHPPQAKAPAPAALAAENEQLKEELARLRAMQTAATANGISTHPTAPADILNHIRR